MKKKKNTSKEIYLNNVYAWGGDFADPKKLKGVLAGSLGSAVGSVLDTTVGGGMTDTTGGKIGSGISNIGGQVGNALSAVNPLLGGIVSAASGLVGGLATRAFGADFNEETIADIENQNRQMSNTVVASGSNSDIMAQWADQEWGDNFTKSDLGKEGWFSNAVTDKYNTLKKEQQAARNRVLSSYDNAIENTEKQSTLNMLANYSALGGPIHIKPSKRGTFTAAATKHGMGVQAFANRVLANKENYSPAMVKKANFARNAAKWHADGGFLTHGGIFNNGVTTIGNGDSHENNPYEGVPMGVDPQGVPNLVEENEVIWNDYVFSNRLKTNKEIRSKYKMRESKEMSFADMAKKLSKESEERPNDPISKRGLEANLTQLAMEQEGLKMNKDKKNSKSAGNKFWGGGPVRYDYQHPTIDDYKSDTDNIDDIELEDIVIPEQVEITNPKFAGFGTTEYDSKGLKGMMRDWDKDKNPFASYLRYTPLIGNITGIAQNLLSKPDYSAADRLNKAAADLSTAPRIGYTPLGDYMSYIPVDTNILTNKLTAESAGLRNTLLNSSSPSRTAALLAADYNAQNALGDAYLKAAEQNLARKQAAATFNRGTNQANAEMGLKASMANAELAQKAKQLGLSATLSAIQARDAVDAARNAALNTNINQFFTGLGNIGKEQQIMKLLSTGKYGYDENGDLIYLGGD